ncbi:MAG: hypothetical protein V3T86_00915 [Planctomycetota bacterium]
MRFCFLWFVAFSSLVVAAPPGDDAKKEKGALHLFGRLEPRKVKKDQPPVFWIQVGSTRYSLELDADANKAAGRLRGKFVSLTVPAPGETGETVTLSVAGKSAVTAQSQGVLHGFVRASKAKPADRKAFPYRLETATGTFEIAAADARKFKKHVGAYVAAKTRRTSDGRYGRLESVKSVERALAPGAREPKKGEDALAGNWKGTMTVGKVPGGVPGVSVGDKFKVSFAANDGLEKVTGRFFDTYDVNGLHARKFARKKRTIRFDIDYTFGQGTYACRCEGKFTDDWKKIAGEWSSGFLGSGTFEIDWSESKDVKGK